MIRSYPMTRRNIGLSGMVLACAVWSFASVAQAADLKTVAIRGDASPIGGLDYKAFQAPEVSDDSTDEVAFFATARNGTIERCIFKVDDTGAGGPVACKGDPTPNGKQFRDFSNPSMNASGEVAWTAGTTGGNGIFKDDPTLVTFIGDTVAGVTGVLKELSMARITDASHVVFKSTISGPAVVGGVPLDQGIFRCSGGDGNCSSGTGVLEKLVLKNDSLVDPPDRKFCSFNALDASNFGIVFRASTQKDDCTASTQDTSRVGIFRKQFGGAVETIALESRPSNPAPAPGGTQYREFFGEPAIENSGIVTFRASTKNLFSLEILFLCDPATCPAAPADAPVQQGDDDGNGNTFRSFSSPVLSDAGDMAFQAQTKTPGGGTTSGVYIRRANGDIDTVALKQLTPVPDLPGATFLFFGQPAMSSGGDVAFKAKVKATAKPKNREGVFLFE
jgi:hypothetical protein